MTCDPYRLTAGRHQVPPRQPVRRGAVPRHRHRDAYWRLTTLSEFDGRIVAAARARGGRSERPARRTSAGVRADPPDDRDRVPRRPSRARGGRTDRGQSDRRKRPSLERGRGHAAHRPRRLRAGCDLRGGVGGTAVHAGPAGGDRGDQPARRLVRRAARRPARARGEPRRRGHGRCLQRLRASVGPAELLPQSVPVQPRREAGARQPGDGGLSRASHRVLRAVRRHVRGDGSPPRDAGPGRRRLYAGHARRGRPVLGRRPQRPRLAGGLVRRARLGSVRADAGPGRAGHRAVHRREARAGRAGAGRSDHVHHPRRAHGFGPGSRSRFHRSPTLVYLVEARRATASRPRRAACLPSPAAPEAAASPRR